MTSFVTAIALVWATLVLSTPAAAATRRVAVVVGHNAGADGRAPLRYAEEDAGKFADVLVDLGDVAPDDLLLVQGKGSAALHAALTRAAATITRVRAAPDDRVVLLFFYSGHSDGKTIELGNERVSFVELKAWLTSTGADVRIAIIDSCKSGAQVQGKGGTRGPAFSVTLVDDLAARGDVMLTSAAADEDALESAEIRGSFFTHHLVSGMRGAADVSGDGTVTLNEAYEYAFHRTVTATAAAGVTPQHPSFDYRVAGRGELALTEVSRRSSLIELPPGSQRALVIQPRRDQVIAEVTSSSVTRVAVAPGEYALRVWRDGRQAAGRVTVGAGQTVRVTWEQLTALEAPVVTGRKGGGRSEEPSVVEPALPPDQQRSWDTRFLTADGKDRVFRGKAQQQIDQLDAFVLMGRSDLVARANEANNTKAWLTWGGVGLAVGAIVINRLVIDDCADQIIENGGSTRCISNAATVNTIASVAFIGGIVTMIVGIVRDPFRLQGAELDTAVSDYNRTLREKLRTGTPVEPPSTPRYIPGQNRVRSSSTLDLAPWVARDGGGGLAVFGRF